jgi:hypothetical protein
MKITETITRDCCNKRTDLKKYNGGLGNEIKNHQFRFCVHCGQIWTYETDDLGDSGLVKADILSYETKQSF